MRATLPSNSIDTEGFHFAHGGPATQAAGWRGRVPCQPCQDAAPLSPRALPLIRDQTHSIESNSKTMAHVHTQSRSSTRVLSWWERMFDVAVLDATQGLPPCSAAKQELQGLREQDTAKQDTATLGTKTSATAAPKPQAASGANSNDGASVRVCPGHHDALPRCVSRSLPQCTV